MIFILYLYNMKKYIQLGTKFGYLTVTKYLGTKKYNSIYLCKCDCGKERELKVTQLLSLGVNNCGCKLFVSKEHGNKKYDPEEASFRAKATNYKALAKKRDLEFSLSINETISLLKGNCFYCNGSPSNPYNVRQRNRINKKNKTNYASQNSEEYNILYNGIDRIDNSIGYTVENTVSCCTKCNTAKLTSSFDEFKEWVRKVYLNLYK